MCELLKSGLTWTAEKTIGQSRQGKPRPALFTRAVKTRKPVPARVMLPFELCYRSLAYPALTIIFGLNLTHLRALTNRVSSYTTPILWRISPGRNLLQYISFASPRYSAPLKKLCGL
jgi:hypothetical protein